MELRVSGACVNRVGCDVRRLVALRCERIDRVAVERAARCSDASQQRRLVRAPSTASPPPSTATEPSSEADTAERMMHYAESAIPLPPLPATSPPPLARLRAVSQRPARGRARHAAAAAATSVAHVHLGVEHDELDVDDHDDDADTSEADESVVEEAPTRRRASRRSRRASFGAVGGDELPSLRRRHQSQYFSSVDLFHNQDADFNYLKYSKASEARAPAFANPHLRVM